MNYKIYFSFFLFISSLIFAQTQNINYGNINFEMSSKYQIINMDVFNEVTKDSRGQNKFLDETYKQIELDYNERIIFNFKNLICNCLNNLVLSQTKNGFSFSNSDYSTEELQNEIKNMYDESIQASKEKVNNSGVAKYLKINPTSFNKTKNVNYFHISSEMLMLHNNKTVIADIFTIPVKDFFYQVEFSTDKKNYETVLPMIKEMLNTIKINE